jgi:hypothetical protein
MPEKHPPNHWLQGSFLPSHTMNLPTILALHIASLGHHRQASINAKMRMLHVDKFDNLLPAF